MKFLLIIALAAFTTQPAFAGKCRKTCLISIEQSNADTETENLILQALEKKCYFLSQDPRSADIDLKIDAESTRTNTGYHSSLHLSFERKTRNSTANMGAGAGMGGSFRTEIQDLVKSTVSQVSKCSKF